MFQVVPHTAARALVVAHPPLPVLFLCLSLSMILVTHSLLPPSILSLARSCPVTNLDLSSRLCLFLFLSPSALAV